MHNFSKRLVVFLSCASVGCMDHSQPLFFDNNHVNSESNQISFSDIHQLNLSIGEIENTIDETGFSPKLNTRFQLSSAPSSVWSQAWIALNIDVMLDGKKLASMHKADVIHEHVLMIEFQQILPRFGIQARQIDIQVTPIGWMPTYPLLIDAQASMPSKTLNKNPASVAKVKS